jgi:lipopolysaccharide export system permease protein
MNRLKRYLVGQFASEAVTLFGVAVTLVFLVQCLRVIDAGSVRGQGLVTLGAQVLLALPSVSMAFIHVCLGIGMARALRSMQATRELHILHVSGKLGALAGAATIYATIGAIVLLFVAHVVDPAASRENSLIRGQVAADLVGRSLVPNRFAEVADGVTITVGGRRANGEITSFFADDRRASTRQTYIADTALITRDEAGYVLQLSNGTVQYRTAEGRFSEVEFERYDLAFDRLIGASDSEGGRGDNSSLAVISAGFSDGWTSERQKLISQRMVDGVRALTICFFVFAIAAFPSGRRRESRIPIEIVVLGASFFERVLFSYAPGEAWLQPFAGVFALAVISTLILLVQLKPVAALRARAAA